MIPLGVLAARRPVAGGFSMTSLGVYNPSNATTSVSQTIDLGTPSAGREIVLAIGWRAVGNQRITAAPVIAGVTATLDAGDYSTNLRGGSLIVRAAVPTGTTGNVTFSTAFTGATIYMEAFAATGPLAVADAERRPFTAGETAASITLNPAGEFVAACGGFNQNYASHTGLEHFTIGETNRVIVGYEDAPGATHTFMATIGNIAIANYNSIAAVAYQAA